MRFLNLKSGVAFASLLVAGAAAGGGVALPTAAVERGGVTFDFDVITEARFRSVFDPARNLLANPPPPERLTATKTFTFAVPHTNGGVWRVSCRYRLRHEKPGRAEFFVEPGGYRFYLIPESGDTWGILSETAKLSPGESAVKATFRLNEGQVALDCRDFTLVDETPTVPVVARWTQSSLLDGTFAVSEGQVCSIDFVWRRTVARDFPVQRFTARLELPPGIAFVDAVYADRETVRTERRADGSSVTTFRVGAAARPPIDSVAGWAFMPTVVKATRKSGDAGVGWLTLSYDNDGERFQVPLGPVRFQVIPAIKAAAPKVYANGIMPTENEFRLSPAANAELATFIGDCGVTWVASGGKEPDEIYGLLRKAGVRRLTPSIWPCNDGYSIRGNRDPVPASDRFVALDEQGRPTKLLETAVCPVTVYEGSDYFRGKTVPWLRQRLVGTDGAWANWEPFRFVGKGCFCDRCLRKFADYVGKPYESVKADWPACVLKGGVYHDRIAKFRSREHAKIVKALDREVRACTGGEKSLGLIPGIAWVEMSSVWRPRNLAAEVQAIDYAGGLRWMCPWGPYAAWEAAYPYVDARRKPLCQFLAAKDIRRTVDADYPVGTRPKLMALPQGQQCVHWLTQPENLGMAFDSNFFNGFEATLGYYFPQGYDARYWERLADATGRAAKYEDFVLSGTRVDEAVVVRTDAAYAPPVRSPSGYLPDVRDASRLQTVAWRLGDRTIVAVLNFWERGEAFFDLRVSGLSDKVAVVDERGVLRAADRRHATYDGAALAVEGVRLVVPAARCRVFEFRADGRLDDATSVLTDEDIRTLYELRRGDLRRAAEEDAARERGYGPATEDYMPVI